ncbi:MAG: type II toxin-antitoxin system VapC family toxin [Tagaea sp.]
MIACVADASVLIKLAVDEIDSVRARAYLATQETSAPAIIVAELANVLRRLIKSRLRTASEARTALAQILSTTEILPETDKEARLTLELAIALDHPAQDCRYLAAAIVAKVPLITADESFARKARAAGYEARAISELTFPFG